MKDITSHDESCCDLAWSSAVPAIVLVVSWFVLFEIPPSYACAPEAVTEEFSNLATEVCGPYRSDEGWSVKGGGAASVEGTLGRILRIFTDAGVELGGDVSVERWKGAKQEHIADLDRSNRECRLRLFEIFLEEFRDAGLTYQWDDSKSDALVVYAKECDNAQFDTTYTCDEYHLGWSVASVKGKHKWHDNKWIAHNFHGEVLGYAVGYGAATTDPGGRELTYYGARETCEGDERRRVPVTMWRCILTCR